MKKERLSALDGLRGLAALSVTLSHAGFSIQSITTLPLVVFLWRTLAVGPNSVQIFFVLSGFLMASLYPVVQNSLQFIQKRYARIFPVLTVVVIYMGVVYLRIRDLNWYEQLFFLLLLAFIVHIGWRLISRFDRLKIAGRLIFWSFLILQVAFLLINLFITPKFISLHQVVLPVPMRNALLIISNFTLTTPFARDVVRFASIFWSLLPEIIFYLVYPFLVIPLIKIGKRYGRLVTLIIIILVTKILFDFDDALRGTLAMFTLNISRASGFLVGVLVGTLYASGGKLWQKLQPVFQNTFVNLMVLTLFILSQAGDWAVRDGQIIWFMNAYYLASSWIAGLLVATAIIPKTLNQRIFSNKLFVFLGLISYSLYLIHSRTADWGHQIARSFESAVTSRTLFGLLDFGLMLGISIVTAYLLYCLVETLYFQAKAKTKPVDVKISGVAHSQTRPVIPIVIILFIFIWVYTAAFTPSQFISQHSYPRASLLQTNYALTNRKVHIPITAKYNNLSVVTVGMWYFKNGEVTARLSKKPAQLWFRLFAEDQSKPIFSVSRSAYDVESEPNFPFGFPPIADSAGKQYLAELEVIGAKPKDTVYLNTMPGRVTATYTNTKAEIIKKPHLLVWNRLWYTFTHPDNLFNSGILLAIFLVILILQRKPNNLQFN